MAAPAHDGFTKQTSVSPEEAGIIRAELDRILRSPVFRTSRRSSEFLSWVVQETLDGRAPQLKERSIGMAVFHREPGYDTSEDATVRVAANEVRKRLSQYGSENPDPAVRIEIQPGTYVPEFHFAHAVTVSDDQRPASAPAPAIPSGHSRLRWALAFLVLLGAVTTGIILRPGTPVSAFDQFWAPLMTSGRTPLLCLTHPVVYVLTDKAIQDYATRNNLDLLSGPQLLPMSPNQMREGDIVASPDQFVGSGDAYAAGQVTALFARKGKALQFRIGKDISFADLRAAPSILIGAYSNRWTMQANSEYRFGFAHFSVVDRSDSSRIWRLPSVTPDYKSPEDYAIVSRVLQAYSGEMLITAAGITNYGTQAAAEFLTNPTYLNTALASAPSRWYDKNVQYVLHCKIIGSTPGPPVVVAAHYW